ncbi:MAG: dimethyl sulfoxide reductase anchor subunit, partial [Xanthomonadales bacterium]|nr:dimethyl sulfoxide reductase anchor subunit [Xanthomonadales bacterium]
MRPSFSVIVFTVLAGAGYGLWLWLGLALALGIYPLGRSIVLVPLAFGFVLVSVGLLASTSHLGKPQRAWRGFSQWRSSWLSREAVLAVVTYVPMVAVALLAHGDHGDAPTRAAGLLLAVFAGATVFATAHIYHALKPIAAWRNALVVPGYLLMAMASGGLWLWLFLAVRYHSHGLHREGVASTFLADRIAEGETVPVYVDTN